MSALCPHCGATITHLSLEGMTSSAFMGTQWNTVAYVCPMCRKILSVSIDPIAIRTDIINAMKQNRA